MAVATHHSFRAWLSDQFDTTGIPRREIARRLASKHPKGATPATIETFRGAIYRYLKGTMIPTVATRNAFAEAFGVDPSTVPATDEDEESEPNLDATLLMIAAQRADLAKLERQLFALRDNGAVKA